MMALPASVEVLVIGGGITGAGIFREAARAGVSVALVEARDFGSGTSSWSSKLVHGGLRYLQTGEWSLTRESVRERQRLLREAPGLVQPLDFLMPQFTGGKPGMATVRFGLRLYDLFARGGPRSRRLDPSATLALRPEIRRDGLRGGLMYRDARTDDCRLVWQLIAQGQRDGGHAAHYTRVTQLLRAADGRVGGARLQDADDGTVREIAARTVVNATGIWSATLGMPGDRTPPLRPLRGSHLVFPHARLPLTEAVSWFHPRDRRGVFVTPWQGATLLGTTDLDHADDLWEPAITRAEVDYLLEGLTSVLPGAGLGTADALSAFSGVRPVVAQGSGKPSSASRESALWQEPGLVGVTGGKLTTFRVTARQVLSAVQAQLPALRLAPDAAPLFDADAVAQDDAGAAPTVQQVSARAGECVRHLDDLLLRRTRAGLVLPEFGEAMVEPALAACRAQYGWDETRCRQEADDYRRRMQHQHRVPA
jgi:glycerol-3-phosphate dehydrogenase